MQALIGGNGGSLDPSRVGELQETSRSAAGIARLVDQLPGARRPGERP